MSGVTRIEAELDASRSVHLALSETAAGVGDFFGTVSTANDLGRVSVAGKTVYVTGDLSRLESDVLRDAARVFIVDGLSSGEHASFPRVGLGRVPLRVGGVGVYFRQRTT